MRARVAILTLVVLALSSCGAGDPPRPAPPTPPGATATRYPDPFIASSPSPTGPVIDAPTGTAQAAMTATARPAATTTRAATGGATPTGGATCPVTAYATGPPTNSDGDRAIGGLRPYSWYGGDGLWAFPWVQGEPPGVLYLHERGYHKVLWWREPGVEGGITVMGHRLDGAGGTVTADFEGNATQRGQQPGGLTFSAPGCWAITGEAGGKRLTFVALVTAAPGAASPTPASPSARSSTPTAAGSPAACDGGTARELLARFLDAFDRGDRAALGAFLTARHADLGVGQPGEAGLLHWYAAAGPAPVDAYTRDAALAYFAARHAWGERLHLGAVRYADDERNGIVGTTFLLTRQADDLAARRAIGKAAFTRAGGTIVRWAMGPEDARP